MRVPERVPFRMTQNIETALGVTGVEVCVCFFYFLLGIFGQKVACSFFIVEKDVYF